MFPFRVALRIKEMVRAIPRGGLPGVVRNDKAFKTTGTIIWGGAGVFRRLVGREDEAPYLEHLYHSLYTLLESSRASREERARTVDAAGLAMLTQFVPKPTAPQVEALKNQHNLVARACKRLFNEQLSTATVQAVYSQVASSSSALPPPPPPAILGAAAVPPPTRPKPPPPSEPYPSSTEGSDLGDATDAEDDPNADDEADSRGVATDDSWDRGSEASTESYGFSPAIAPPADGDEPATPSLACTEGASQASV